MLRSAPELPTLSLLTILRFCLADGVPRRSLLVALIVGAILNIINQGDVLLVGADVDLVKIILTFIVPYCVATYGAVSFQIAALKVETYGPFPTSDTLPGDGAKAARKDQQ